jgi:hypothetical protein
MTKISPMIRSGFSDITAIFPFQSKPGPRLESPDSPGITTRHEIFLRKVGGFIDSLTTQERSPRTPTKLKGYHDPDPENFIHKNEKPVLKSPLESVIDLILNRIFKLVVETDSETLLESVLKLVLE